LSSNITRDVIVKADLFNQPVLANANILPSNLAGIHKPISYFILTFCFQGAGIFNIMRTKDGVSLPEGYREAATLVPNGAYIHAIAVSTGETINFQYTTATTLTSLKVLETVDQ